MYVGGRAAKEWWGGQAGYRAARRVQGAQSGKIAVASAVRAEGMMSSRGRRRQGPHTPPPHPRAVGAWQTRTQSSQPAAESSTSSMFTLRSLPLPCPCASPSASTPAGTRRGMQRGTVSCAAGTDPCLCAMSPDPCSQSSPAASTATHPPAALLSGVADRLLRSVSCMSTEFSSGTDCSSSIHSLAIWCLHRGAVRRRGRAV